MTEWHAVMYNFPSYDTLTRIEYARNMQTWFKENNIEDWHTLRDEDDNMMIGYAFKHERDAIMFSLRWL